MKLSFKTQPQLGEWSQLEALWRAADEMPEIGPPAGCSTTSIRSSPNRTDGPCFEGWTALSYLAGGDVAPATSA